MYDFFLDSRRSQNVVGLVCVGCGVFQQDSGYAYIYAERLQFILSAALGNDPFEQPLLH